MKPWGWRRLSQLLTAAHLRGRGSPSPSNPLRRRDQERLGQPSLGTSLVPSVWQASHHPRSVARGFSSPSNDSFAQLPPPPPWTAIAKSIESAAPTSPRAARATVLWCKPDAASLASAQNTSERPGSQPRTYSSPSNDSLAQLPPPPPWTAIAKIIESAAPTSARAATATVLWSKLDAASLASAQNTSNHPTIMAQRFSSPSNDALAQLPPPFPWTRIAKSIESAAPTIPRVVRATVLRCKLDAASQVGA